MRQNISTTSRIPGALDQNSRSAFALRLRIPEWTTASLVTVNGVSMPTSIDRSAVLIQRTWNSGDVVEMILPQSYRTEPIDRQHTDTVAVMRGPMMYVGLTPPTAPAIIQHISEEPPAAAAGFSLVLFLCMGSREIYDPFRQRRR